MGWLTAIPFSFTLIQLIIFSLNKYRNMEYIHIEKLNTSSQYDTLLGIKGEDMVLVDNINIDKMKDIENRVSALEDELEGVNNILASI